MSDSFSVEIPIPSDDEGYVLLQCPTCGTYFKLTPSDAQDEGVLHLFCPSCGLAGESFLTEDVLNLALAKTKNTAMDYIYTEFKKLERQTRKGLVQIKAGRPPKHEPEDPIRSGIEAMEVASFPCCRRTAKIKPLLKMTGCYCPFCGVKNFEIE